MDRYPGKIPIIAEKGPGGIALFAKADIGTADKRKFLAPGSLSLSQFTYIIRNRIKLGPEQGLFLYVKGAYLPPSSSMLSSIYQDYKDDDGFLYMVYAGENTFGGCDFF